jgi:tight adherence protein B
VTFPEFLMSLAWLGSLLIGLAACAGAWGLVTSDGSWLDALEKNWSDQLRRIRVSTTRLRIYLLIWLGIVATVAVIVWVGFGAPLFAVVAVAALLTVPWLLIRRMARIRKERIEDQLADAMVSLSSAIRAGLSLPQSLEVLATQCPRPIREEFQQLYGEYQLGKTMDVCLKEARERLQSEHFALFAAAMEASRQSGGRLNEVVERIAVSVRELHRLERKILAETAESRRSALYMSLAPGVILAMYWAFLDPESVERLFSQTPGQLVLVAAALLNVVAWLWAQRILDADL